jgi:DNA mismatch endonuclease (patch repair protein)
MVLTRSQQMSRIRGKNTSPELLLRKALFHLGLRFRVHYATAAGKVDIAFCGQRLAVEVDGCFWHGCPDHYVAPKSSMTFWRAKLRENVARDRRQTLALVKDGWRVIRVWEHEVEWDPAAVANRILNACRLKPVQQTLDWRLDSVKRLKDGRELRILSDLTVPERTRTVLLRRKATMTPVKKRRG